MRYLAGVALSASALVLVVAAATFLAPRSLARSPFDQAQGGQPGPAEVAGEGGPIVREATQADLDLSMVILPGYAGTNDVAFYMIDVDRDWKKVQRFSVRFTYLDGKTEMAYDLTQLHEGHFPLDGVSIPYAGRWRADVDIVRAEAGENRFSFDFALSHR